jgi:hypothetical protein
VVYIIKPARLDYVKIGITRGICQRMYELQAGSPERLRVLALFAGGVDLEARLHYTFINYHTQGEWFFMGREIKRMIEALHQPGFDVYEWVAARDSDIPPSEGDIKRYIGGKVTLAKSSHGFGHPDRKRRNGKLSEADVAYILRNPDNLTTAELGRRFEVTRVMVGKIRNGKSWKGAAERFVQNGLQTVCEWSEKTVPTEGLEPPA